MLIVKPPVDVSTQDAYAQLDLGPSAVRPRNASCSLAMLAALQRADFEEVESLLHNDFHEPIAARTPQIGDALAALGSAGARRALLAGSGSCVFALARTHDEIHRMRERLSLPEQYSRFVAAFSPTPDWRA